MKIVFLFPHFLSPGGAASVVLQFARALQFRGNQVEICCAKVSTAFRKANPDINFTELKIPASNSIFYWILFPFWQARINHALDAYENCIFFPHVLPSNWWAWSYKKRNKRAKVVWYCHEPSAFIHSKAWINAIPVRLVRWGAKAVNPFLKKIDIGMEKKNDLVVCNSHFTEKQYEIIYHRKANAVIYPPITRKNTSFEKIKDETILTVGRLSKFKNVDVLIKAFQNVLQRLPKARLIIAGDGEEKEKLKQLTTDLGLEKSVCFKGRVSDEELAGLYQTARVTVICSNEEPFGLVPIESMMYATPVIAHNSGGPKETIAHNITGFLYDDEAELVHFVEEVLAMNSVKYCQMQQDCLKAAIKYDVSNSILQLESILEKNRE